MPAPEGKISPARSYVVLIVEDDPMLGRLYSEKFRHEGFNVLTAGNGEEGLKLATEKNPDAILLDIMLPKADGFSLLEGISAHPRAQHIPIIALTNLANKPDQNKAIKMGVKEYLAKAMNTPEDVVEKVKQYLHI